MIQKKVCMRKEQVLDHFLKNNMELLFGDFNAKLETEDIFKPTIGNGSLH